LNRREKGFYLPEKREQARFYSHYVKKGYSFPKEGKKVRERWPHKGRKEEPKEGEKEMS